MKGSCSGKGVKGKAFREGIPCTLTNRPSGLIEPTGTLRVRRAVGADQVHEPARKEEQGEPDAAHMQAVAA